jgi:peptide/nickel transport system permease protein
VLTLKRTDFVQAARALGGNSSWVIRHHLIPNSIGPRLGWVLGMLAAVTLQATITFIGLGGASPWGALLSLGRNFVIGPGGSLLTHWWDFLPVTLAGVFVGVAWNLVGDGLNDILMPSWQTNFRARSSSRKVTMPDSSPA